MNVINLFGAVSPLYMGAQLHVIYTEHFNIDNREGGNNLTYFDKLVIQSHENPIDDNVCQVISAALI